MAISDDRRRELARSYHEENERAVARYFDEVRGGKNEEEARDIVKRAFSTPERPYGDLRLDRALTTRAQMFAPGSVAELEGMALTHIGRVNGDVGRLRRFYELQLDKIAADRICGKEWSDIEVVEEVGGKFESKKYKRIPLDEAERRILQSLIDTNNHFWAAMTALKIPSVINLNVNDLSNLSTSELESMLEHAKSKHQKQ